MSRDEDADLKAQLLEAKTKIVRQLEILRDPASTMYVPWINATPDNRGVVADLEKELAEIEDGLKRFETPQA